MWTGAQHDHTVRLIEILLSQFGETLRQALAEEYNIGLHVAIALHLILWVRSEDLLVTWK